MSTNARQRVGYVLKMYPRFSETFIVQEILAHEAAGMPVEIFSLRPPIDGRFHPCLAHVQAPVTYLPHGTPKARALWETMGETMAQLPGGWPALARARTLQVEDLHQGLVLTQETLARGITHLHAHFASVATTVARLAARLAGITYSFTAHAKDIYHQDVCPEDLRGKLADATAAVTVSDYNLRYLQDTFGSAAAGVQRIYNGLDLQRLGFTSPAERSNTILAVGRLVEKKGFAHLVEACALLRGRGRQFRCQIIGAGPLQASLLARIDALGLEGWVALLGPQPQQTVFEHMGRAAVLAVPCVVAADGNRDGLPTVLLEAMALGTPCVATDVTGIPEVLHHDESGLLVDQGNPVMLADALERLLLDESLRTRLARQARLLVETRFDIHCNARALRTLFGHGCH